MPADTAQPDAIEDADIGAETAEQTHGDSAAARQPNLGDKPETGSDDSTETSDPLVLAQMEPETQEPAKPAAPKPTTSTPPKTTAAKPAATAKQDTAQEAADTAEDDAGDEQPEAPEPEIDEEALADLPAEDWAKVSHKGKSQFIAQRKAIRASQQRIKLEADARRKAEQRITTVERFVKQHGLGNEEYANGVAILGLAKRDDPAVIPVLEETLSRIRKARGIQVPQPQAAAPVIDDAAIDEALSAALAAYDRDFDADKAKAKARQALSQRKAATPPAPPAAVQPTQQGQQQGQQQAPAMGSEAEEHLRIADALEALGAKPVERLQELIRQKPELAKVPAGQRFAAVLRAHHEIEGTGEPKATTQRKPAEQPLSGRGGPQTTRGVSPKQPADPLKLALARPGR